MTAALVAITAVAAAWLGYRFGVLIERDRRAARTHMDRLAAIERAKTLHPSSPTPPNVIFLRPRSAP